MSSAIELVLAWPNLRVAAPLRRLRRLATSAPMLGRLLRAPLARAGALLSPRVAAPAAARTLAAHSSLPLPLAPPLLGGGQWRSIITVNVYSPSRRGDFTSPQAYQAEVMKSEEIALNRFNRLLRNEVERGTIPKGGRPQKRWSRFVKPYKRRLLAKANYRWKKHKARMDFYLRWIQFRRMKEKG